MIERMGFALAAAVGIVLGLQVARGALPFWPVAGIIILILVASKTLVWAIDRAARRG